MGKITSALKKAAEERLNRIDKIHKVKESRSPLIARKVGNSKLDPNLVTYFDPKALISEQYKILRTNILSMNKGNPPKCLVITSSINGEGKTVTALNLAMSLSHSVSKPKVLVIDADLRKGRLDRYLGVESKSGLTEILSGKATLDESVFQLDMGNLAFVSSGKVPQNPAELLASDNMRKFLSRAKAQFDYVIIDAPPVIHVTDAGILGAQVEGVLMVIQAGRTQRGILKRAEELLHQSRTKILGHILTNIEYHLPEYLYRYL